MARWKARRSSSCRRTCVSAAPAPTSSLGDRVVQIDALAGRDLDQRQPRPGAEADRVARMERDRAPVQVGGEAREQDRAAIRAVGHAQHRAVLAPAWCSAPPAAASRAARGGRNRASVAKRENAAASGSTESSSHRAAVDEHQPRRAEHRQPREQVRRRGHAGQRLLERGLGERAQAGVFPGLVARPGQAGGAERARPPRRAAWRSPGRRSRSPSKRARNACAAVATAVAATAAITRPPRSPACSRAPPARAPAPARRSARCGRRPAHARGRARCGRAGAGNG